MGRSEVEYEVLGRPFPAQFKGSCTLNWDHSYKRGDMVARVQRADNPLLPIPGVACAACVRILPRAQT